MLLRGLVQCVRNVSFRMFPVFPQLQLALPAIQRSPMAIMKPDAESKKMDLVEWLQESFLLCNSCMLHNRYNGETREY